MEDMAEDIDITDVVQDPVQDQDLVQERDVEGHNRQMIPVPSPNIHVQQV